jgi:hypothetical protein
MTKYILLLALGFVTLTGSAGADEVSKSTSTEVRSPDYNSSSSSSSTTTTENDPTTVKQESSYSESSPGKQEQVITTKKYSVPTKRQRTVTRHSETEVSR